MREYIDALEEFNPTDDDDAEPPEPPAPGKNVSLTDPAARWTAAPGGPAFYAYSTNYLIDLDDGIIADVAATPAHRTQEVEATKTMIDPVEERFGMKPDRLVVDTAYGSASPRMCPCGTRVNARTARCRAASSSGMSKPTNRCPQGHALLSDRRQFAQPRDHITKAGTILYSASQHDCTGCPMNGRRQLPRRRSRCCSRISNASSSRIGCA